MWKVNKLGNNKKEREKIKIYDANCIQTTINKRTSEMTRDIHVGENYIISDIKLEIFEKAQVLLSPDRKPLSHPPSNKNKFTSLF
jgi:hypothetical protein